MRPSAAPVSALRARAGRAAAAPAAGGAAAPLMALAVAHLAAVELAILVAIEGCELLAALVLDFGERDRPIPVDVEATLHAIGHALDDALERDRLNLGAAQRAVAVRVGFLQGLEAQELLAVHGAGAGAVALSIAGAGPGCRSHGRRCRGGGRVGVLGDGCAGTGEHGCGQQAGDDLLHELLLWGLWGFVSDTPQASRPAHELKMNTPINSL